MNTNEQFVIDIDEAGNLAFVWDDRLVGLLEAGKPNVQRASHVEPTTEGKWQADMGPVGGPVLGDFTLRASALAAEREWLRKELAL